MITPPAPKSVIGTVAGLFSGIGGLELGMHSAGFESTLLCEYWEPAASTLRRRFPGVEVLGDIRGLKALPSVDVVAAGFPCTDLSQAGRTAGLAGAASGLVREALRLVDSSKPRWVILENVPNLLTLDGGSPIRAITSWFDEHGWNWAYRTVDSQYFGVRQRRRRVFIVASRSEDPRMVLFADEAPLRKTHARQTAYGFSWTEGNRGLGWGPGVTPTLKGGSGLGIASPPGVWLVNGEPGSAIVRPSIEAGEKLQGFRPGWTSAVEREGIRWKLVGNAVSVPVAQWIGRRLADPGLPTEELSQRWDPNTRWPWAASSVRGYRQSWAHGERPLAVTSPRSLASLLSYAGWHPLSFGATRGFTERLERSSLRRDPDFMIALKTHLAYLD